MLDFGWLTERPIAHRGYHDRAAGRIENTLSAARAAIDRGFPVECDVHLTRDDAVVVFHDEMLDRLSDAAGPVRGKSLAQLRSVRLLGTDDTIPTLPEICEIVAGRVPLIVEIKSLTSGEPNLAKRVAETLSGFPGPFAVMSFDPKVLNIIRPLAPALPLGMLAYRFDSDDSRHLSPLARLALRHLMLAPFTRPDFIAYEVSALPANAPLLLRHIGLPLLTWTVRTREERLIADRYADQMIFEGFDPFATDTA